ncbi:hypothetical protein [Novosphingobium sp. BL-52-GroH]|uniref:hypothetical protein n=1 Tax=Novosphingobium sp. BL-52-GroH TaxID=3349877 RepID=UPI00384CF897
MSALGRDLMEQGVERWQDFDDVEVSCADWDRAMAVVNQEFLASFVGRANPCAALPRRASGVGNQREFAHLHQTQMPFPSLG